MGKDFACGCFRLLVAVSADIEFHSAVTAKRLVLTRAEQSRQVAQNGCTGAVGAAQRFYADLHIARYHTAKLPLCAC